MANGVPSVTCAAVSRSWSFTDFLVIFLGGRALGIAATAFLTQLWGEELILIFALLSQYLAMAAILALMALRRQGGDLGFELEPSDAKYLMWGALLQIVLSLLILPLSTALLPQGEPTQDVGNALLETDRTWVRLATFALLVILVPVVEELLFRGVLLNVLSNRSARVAIVTSAALFALVHLPGLDPDTLWQSAVVTLPRLFVVGLGLAWITLRVKRLGPAIFLHAGVNLVAALIFLVPREVLDSLG